MTRQHAIRRLAGVATLTLAASLPAHAAFDWVFSTANCVSGPCSSTGVYGSTMVYSSPTGKGNATVRGISNTGSGGDLASAQVALWSGVGVKNAYESGSSPNHAADNSGYIDAVLIDFGASLVTLDSLQIGWPSSSSSYDSDITLLAYTGSGNPLNAGDGDYLGNLDYSQLLSQGWAHAGDYSNVAQQPGKTVSVNGGGYSSSLWLVSAFNPFVSSKNWSTGNDYFKLSALGGRVGTPPSGIPEPGTLALLAAGLGVMRLRRR